MLSFRDTIQTSKNVADTTFKDLEKGLTKKNVTEKFSALQKLLTYCIKHKENIISKYETGQFGAKTKGKC